MHGEQTLVYRLLQRLLHHDALREVIGELELRRLVLYAVSRSRVHLPPSHTPVARPVTRALKRRQAAGTGAKRHEKTGASSVRLSVCFRGHTTARYVSLNSLCRSVSSSATIEYLRVAAHRVRRLSHTEGGSLGDLALSGGVPIENQWSRHVRQGCLAVRT